MSKKIHIGSMSREQAIGILNKLIVAMKTYDGVSPTQERINALQMAIDSLEVDEAYQMQYEQPTTKNDLAFIHTEGLDEGIRCAMCTNSIKSDRGCDGGCVVNNAMYKEVMDVIENHIVDTDKMVEPTTPNDCENCIHNKGVLECDMYGCKYEPTTKNDLGVDAVSREKAIKWAEFYTEIYDAEVANKEIMKMLRDMPSVTPQESRKGHWTEEFNDLEGEVRFTCSSCGNYQLFGTDFCYHCGSDNREVVEE